MTSAARKCIVALGLILAVGVGAAGGYAVGLQSTPLTPPTPFSGIDVGAAGGCALGLQSTQPTPPTVFSGVDVGFRMEGRKGNTPVGRLVVRIDAQWVAVNVCPVARVVATDAR